MTTGSMMFFGGLVAIAAGVVLGVICLRVFPRQRKRLLEKLGRE